MSLFTCFGSIKNAISSLVMCSGRYPTNVVCSMQFYRNGGDIEAARPATKLEFQNSQVTIAVIMSPFSVCYFHSPQPRNAEISIP